MKTREIIIAALLGCIVGFGTTLAIYNINQSSNAKVKPVVVNPAQPQNISTESLSPTPIVSPSPIKTSHQLEIKKPENESIVDKSTVNITGTTTPKSLIIAKNPIDTQIVTADIEGIFSLTLKLDGGANQIDIISVNPEGDQASISLLVTYSTTKI